MKSLFLAFCWLVASQIAVRACSCTTVIAWSGHTHTRMLSSILICSLLVQSSPVVTRKSAWFLQPRTAQSRCLTKGDGPLQPLFGSYGIILLKCSVMGQRKGRVLRARGGCIITLLSSIAAAWISMAAFETGAWTILNFFWFRVIAIGRSSVFPLSSHLMLTSLSDSAVTSPGYHVVPGPVEYWTWDELSMMLHQEGSQLDRKVTSQDCPTMTSGAVAVGLRSALSTVLLRALSLDPHDLICERFLENRRNRH